MAVNLVFPGPLCLHYSFLILCFAMMPKTLVILPDCVNVDKGLRPHPSLLTLALRESKLHDEVRVSIERHMPSEYSCSSRWCPLW